METEKEATDFIICIQFVGAQSESLKKGVTHRG